MVVRRLAYLALVVTTALTLASCTPYHKWTPEQQAQSQQFMENWNRAMQESQARQRQRDEDEIRRLTLQQLRQQQIQPGWVGSPWIESPRRTLTCRPNLIGTALNCD